MQKEENGGNIPSSDSGIWESVVSSLSGVQAEPRPKVIYCNFNLISADRLFWQQVTANFSLFVLKSEGYCTPQSKKLGYRYSIVNYAYTRPGLTQANGSMSLMRRLGRYVTDSWLAYQRDDERGQDERVHVSGFVSIVLLLFHDLRHSLVLGSFLFVFLTWANKYLIWFEEIVWILRRSIPHFHS